MRMKSFIITGLGFLVACSHAPEKNIFDNSNMTAPASIDKEKIRAVVISHLKEIKKCYEDSLEKNPKIQGKIVIQWMIGGAGQVLEAHIKSTSLNHPETEKCAVERLKTWVFPIPPPTEVAVVSYPFFLLLKE